MVANADWDCCMCRRPTRPGDRALVCGTCWQEKSLHLAVDMDTEFTMQNMLGGVLEFLLARHKRADLADAEIAELKSIISSAELLRDRLARLR